MHKQVNFDLINFKPIVLINENYLVNESGDVYSLYVKRQHEASIKKWLFRSFYK